MKDDFANKQFLSQYGWKLHHKKKYLRFWSDPLNDKNVYDENRAIRIQEARNQLINKIK